MISPHRNPALHFIAATAFWSSDPCRNAGRVGQIVGRVEAVSVVWTLRTSLRSKVAPKKSYALVDWSALKILVEEEPLPVVLTHESIKAS